MPEEKGYTVFLERFNKVIANPNKENIVIDFGEEQLKKIYQNMKNVVEVSVYAELEGIIVSIKNTIDVMITKEKEKIRDDQGGEELTEEQINKSTKRRIQTSL